MFRSLLCVLALALSMTGQAVAQQTPFAPVAVVNGSAVTGFDLEQRSRLLQALAESRGDAAQIQRAALDQLIDDRLKLQEGARLGLAPTEAAIDEGIEAFAKQRGMTVEQLNARLDRAGISRLALRDLMAAEVVWLEVVRSRFAGRVDPAEGEIDAEIGLIGQGAPNTAYRLQEIGIPVAPGQEQAAAAAAAAVRAELADGADFATLVREYSRAPSAAKNGMLGWVDANRLPPELASTLASLRPGEVTPPLEVAAGYSIVKMLEVRRGETPGVADVSPEMREQVRRRMVEQRAGRLSDGLLQELRRDALIQIK